MLFPIYFLYSSFKLISFFQPLIWTNISLEKIILDELNIDPLTRAESLSLEDFIKNKLQYYSENKNNPSTDAISGLSKYLNLGFDDYLAKPIEKQELIRILNKFL